MTKGKVLIAFYPRNGPTEILANAIAEGAIQAKADSRLRRAREFVDQGTMSQAPGWRENADVVNAKYDASTEADAARFQGRRLASVAAGLLGAKITGAA
ncbi:hypothetical protein [Neorhizobium sp. T25_27]|uniref:hypothetical protein n=1 Tax=Neorhizobium sp. T25_27 TaxID=2093831 RepID=UPI000CF8C9F3|nr:hypothetical protein [Neorhizobium sp. T25_27]